QIQAVYIVLDSDGKVIQKCTRFSSTAKLNRSEMPVYAKGKIYWVGNNTKSDKNDYVYIYSIELTDD
ncbi:MAG: hypothetical protein ACI4J1_00220, partial [Ruminiclostridium sp.]